MTINEITPLTPSTFIAAFIAHELATCDETDLRETLDAFDNDFERITELALDDCRDNLTDDLAPIFFSFADANDADFDAIDIRLDSMLESTYDALMIALPIAYRNMLPK